LDNHQDDNILELGEASGIGMKEESVENVHALELKKYRHFYSRNQPIAEGSEQKY
jgi:hypothetical protein